MLIAFGGLPGAGKSTLARALAFETGAVWLRIDSVEQALRDSGDPGGDMGPAGYMAAAAVAGDNLRLGRCVVADSVNPLPVTRGLWAGAAEAAGVRLLEIEIACSDPAEHRARVETRVTDIPGHDLPDWEAVVTRDYAPWPGAVRIDTSGRDVSACLGEILALPPLRDLMSG